MREAPRGTERGVPGYRSYERRSAWAVARP